MIIAKSGQHRAEDRDRVRKSFSRAKLYFGVIDFIISFYNTLKYDFFGKIISLVCEFLMK
jgi:hypothetical protein